MTYKNRHSIYFKILAAVLACLLAHNNIAYSLSPTSRFKPITTVQGEDGRDLIAHPAVVPHPLDDYAFPNVVAQDEHTRQIVIEEIKHILTVLKIQLPQEKLDEVTRFNVTGKVRREYIAEYEAKEKEAKREADRTRRLICILNTTTCYLIAMILILIVQDYEFARAISTPILLTAFAAIPIVPAILIQRYIESRLSGPLEVSIMREKGDFFVSGSVDDDGQATIEIDTYSDTKNENARGINGLRKVITHEFVHTLRLACVIREEEYAATAEEIRAAELGDAHSFYYSSGILEEGRGFYRKSKNVEDALKAARYEAAMRTALTGIGWMAAEIGAKSPSEEAFHYLSGAFAAGVLLEAHDKERIDLWDAVRDLLHIEKHYDATDISQDNTTSLYTVTDEDALETFKSDFMERFKTRILLLSHEITNAYIKEQVEKEKEICGRRWEGERTVRIAVDDPEITGNRDLRKKIGAIEGLREIVFVKVTGLFAHTGQFAHAGLSGKDYDGTPVVYVDASFFNGHRNAVQRHDADEMLQWEDLRVNKLGIDKAAMRSWIIKHIDTPDAGLDTTEYKGLTSRRIAKLFHERSYSLDSVYEALDMSKLRFNYEYINRMLGLYGLDKDALDVNIAARRAPTPVPYKSLDEIKEVLMRARDHMSFNFFRLAYSLRHLSTEDRTEIIRFSQEHPSSGNDEILIVPPPQKGWYAVSELIDMPFDPAEPACRKEPIIFIDPALDVSPASFQEPFTITRKDSPAAEGIGDYSFHPGPIEGIDRLFNALSRDRKRAFHGIRCKAGGHFSMLNIILRKALPPSEYSTGYPNIASFEGAFVYGPYYLEVDKDYPRDLAGIRTTGLPAEYIFHYIVPSINEKEFLLAGMRDAVAKGIIDERYYESESAKIVTYDECASIEILPGSPAVNVPYLVSDILSTRPELSVEEVLSEARTRVPTTEEDEREIRLYVKQVKGIARPVLVLNCGSSSVKYQLIDMSDESVIVDRNGNKVEGKIENIGELGGVANHEIAINAILTSLPLKPIAIGHRIVHGGEKFTASALITEEVEAAIEKYIPFAPLHNPAHLQGIRACRALMREGSLDEVPMVAVFDTAFHQTMPAVAFRYALPDELYEQYGIRRYGFHGSSHRFVSEEAAKKLKKPLGKTKLISVHLGNGCSVAAIRGGKSVDTSMGLTPLEGLVMGTRSGDLDPAILIFLGRQGMTPDDLNTLLNKKSGMLGISGLSNDVRKLVEAEKAGNKLAHLALEIFIYRVVKYIYAYYGVLNGADAIILTGGIGENNQLGPRIMRRLRYHYQQNKKTRPKTPPRIMRIHTNEELVIARDTFKIYEEMTRIPHAVDSVMAGVPGVTRANIVAKVREKIRLTGEDEKKVVSYYAEKRVYEIFERVKAKFAEERDVLDIGKELIYRMLAGDVFTLRENCATESGIESRLTREIEGELRFIERATQFSGREERVIRNAQKMVARLAEDAGVAYESSKPLQIDRDVAGMSRGICSLCFPHVYVFHKCHPENLKELYLHEEIHFASVGFPSRVLNEGMTQYLTVKLLIDSLSNRSPYKRYKRYKEDPKLLLEYYTRVLTPQLQKKDKRYIPMYIQNMEAVLRIVEVVGEEAMIKAYMSGDTAAIVGILGESKWREIVETGHKYSRSQIAGYAGSLKYYVEEIERILKNQPEEGPQRWPTPGLHNIVKMILRENPHVTRNDIVDRVREVTPLTEEGERAVLVCYAVLRIPRIFDKAEKQITEFHSDISLSRNKRSQIEARWREELIDGAYDERTIENRILHAIENQIGWMDRAAPLSAEERIAAQKVHNMVLAAVKSYNPEYTSPKPVIVGNTISKKRQYLCAESDIARPLQDALCSTVFPAVFFFRKTHPEIFRHRLLHEESHYAGRGFVSRTLDEGMAQYLTLKMEVDSLSRFGRYRKYKKYRKNRRLLLDYYRNVITPRLRSLDREFSPLYINNVEGILRIMEITGEEPLLEAYLSGERDNVMFALGGRDFSLGEKRWYDINEMSYKYDAATKAGNQAALEEYLRELDGILGGSTLEILPGSPAVNVPYIVGEIVRENPNIWVSDLMERVKERVPVMPGSSVEAMYPNLEEEIRASYARAMRAAGAEEAGVTMADVGAGELNGAAKAEMMRVWGPDRLSTATLYISQVDKFVADGFGTANEIVNNIFDTYLLDGPVLDVASGFSVLWHYTDDRFKGDWTSLEWNPSYLREAGKRGWGGRLVEGSAEDMEFPDGSFDNVVTLSSFESFTDLGKALKETARVLKPGGRFIYMSDRYAFRASVEDELVRLLKSTFAIDVKRLCSDIPECPGWTFDLPADADDIVRERYRDRASIKDEYEYAMLTELIKQRGDSKSAESPDYNSFFVIVMRCATRVAGLNVIMCDQFERGITDDGDYIFQYIVAGKPSGSSPTLEILPGSPAVNVPHLVNDTLSAYPHLTIHEVVAAARERVTVTGEILDKIRMYYTQRQEDKKKAIAELYTENRLELIRFIEEYQEKFRGWKPEVPAIRFKRLAGEALCEKGDTAFVFDLAKLSSLTWDQADDVWWDAFGPWFEKMQAAHWDGAVGDGTKDYYSPGQFDARVGARAGQLKQYDVELAGKAVLDVGTGDGSGACIAALSGATEVYGIDISEKSLAQARKNASRKGLDITFSNMSASDLSSLDATFDVIMVRAVLCYLPAQWRQRVMEQLYAKLKPRGEIVLYEMTGKKMDVWERKDWKGLLTSAGFIWVAAQAKFKTLVEAYIVRGMKPDMTHPEDEITATFPYDTTEANERLLAEPGSAGENTVTLDGFEFVKLPATDDATSDMPREFVGEDHRWITAGNNYWFYYASELGEKEAFFKGVGPMGNGIAFRARDAGGRFVYGLFETTKRGEEELDALPYDERAKAAEIMREKGLRDIDLIIYTPFAQKRDDQIPSGRIEENYRDIFAFQGLTLRSVTMEMDAMDFGFDFLVTHKGAFRIVSDSWDMHYDSFERAMLTAWPESVDLNRWGDPFTYMASKINERMPFVDAGNTLLPGERTEVPAWVEGSDMLVKRDGSERLPLYARLMRNYASVISRVAEDPKVYYVGLGHNDQHGSMFNIVEPLLESDFSVLVGSEREYMNYEYFQTLVRWGLDDVIDPGTNRPVTESLAFPKKPEIDGRKYTAQFYYGDKKRSVIAYFGMDGTKEYPEELESGYNVLMAGGILLEGEMLSKLISLLDEKAGIFLTQGAVLARAKGPKYRDEKEHWYVDFPAHPVADLEASIFGAMTEINSRAFFSLGQKAWYHKETEFRGDPQHRPIILAKNATAQRLTEFGSAGQMKSLGLWGEKGEYPVERHDEFDDLAESVETKDVYGIQARVIEADLGKDAKTELHEHAGSYHFYSKRHACDIIVLNSRNSENKDIQEEAKFHDAREIFWNGPFTRRVAHAIASAEQVEKFSEDGHPTPYHLAQLRYMTPEQLQAIQNEGEEERSFHRRTLTTRAGHVDMQKIITYEENLRRFAAVHADADKAVRDEIAIFVEHFRNPGLEEYANTTILRSLMLNNPELFSLWFTEKRSLQEKVELCDTYINLDIKNHPVRKGHIASIHFRDRYGVEGGTYFVGNVIKTTNERLVHPLRDDKEREMAIDLLNDIDTILAAHPSIVTMLSLVKGRLVKLSVARSINGADPTQEIGGIAFANGALVMLPLFFQNEKRIKYLENVASEGSLKIDDRDFLLLIRALAHEIAHLFFTEDERGNLRLAIPVQAERLQAFLEKHPLTAIDIEDCKSNPYKAVEDIAAVIFAQKQAALFNHFQVSEITPEQSRREFISNYSATSLGDFLVEYISVYWLDPVLVKEKDPRMFDFLEAIFDSGAAESVQAKGPATEGFPAGSPVVNIPHIVGEILRANPRFSYDQVFKAVYERVGEAIYWYPGYRAAIYAAIKNAKADAHVPVHESPAAFLQVLCDHSELFAAAVSDHGIKVTEIARAIPFDRRVVDRSFETLKKLGVFVPSGALHRYRFSDEMRKVDESGHADAAFTRGAIVKITEIEYRIGIKGDVRPLYRARIPDSDITAVKALVANALQPGQGDEWLLNGIELYMGRSEYSMAEHYLNAALEVFKTREEKEEHGTHHEFLISILRIPIHHIETAPAKGVEFVKGFFIGLEERKDIRRTAAAIEVARTLIERRETGEIGGQNDVKHIRRLHDMHGLPLLSRHKREVLSEVETTLKHAGMNEDPRVIWIFDGLQNAILLEEDIIAFPSSASRSVFTFTYEHEVRAVCKDVVSTIPGAAVLCRRDGKPAVKRYHEDLAKTQPFYTIIIDENGFPMRTVLKDPKDRREGDNISHLLGNRLLEAIGAPNVWVKEGERFVYIREIRGQDIVDFIGDIRDYASERALIDKFLYSLGVAVAEAHITGMCDRPHNFVINIEKLRRTPLDELIAVTRRAIINIDRENALTQEYLERDPAQDIEEAKQTFISLIVGSLPGTGRVLWEGRKELFAAGLTHYLKGINDGYRHARDAFEADRAAATGDIESILHEAKSPHRDDIIRRLTLTDPEIDEVVANIENYLNRFLVNNRLGKYATKGTEAYEKQNKVDIDNAVDLWNEVLPAKTAQERYYVIRYDKTRLQECAVKAGLEGGNTPEAVLQAYVDLLKMRAPDKHAVKLVAAASRAGGTEHLLSVRCYGSRAKTTRSLIGEGRVDIEGALEGQPLRIIGMLNMALAASTIPTGADLGDYSSLVSFIQNQYEAITGQKLVAENMAKAIRYIVLPPMQPLPIGKLGDYYRLTIQQLRQSA